MALKSTLPKLPEWFGEPVSCSTCMFSPLLLHTATKSEDSIWHRPHAGCFGIFWNSGQLRLSSAKPCVGAPSTFVPENLLLPKPKTGRGVNFIVPVQEQPKRLVSGMRVTRKPLKNTEMRACSPARDMHGESTTECWEVGEGWQGGAGVARPKTARPQLGTPNGALHGVRTASVLRSEKVAPQVGLEPTTLRLTAECSAIELLRNRKQSL